MNSVACPYCKGRIDLDHEGKVKVEMDCPQCSKAFILKASMGRPYYVYCIGGHDFTETEIPSRLYCYCSRCNFYKLKNDI